ncbi:MAG: hypothetical protein Q4F72_12550, partial [Desulfovibrionaceae bacterium]|nr:hypothetical protein [Desulfovibrionaceae bacterium]
LCLFVSPLSSFFLHSGKFLCRRPKGFLGAGKVSIFHLPTHRQAFFCLFLIFMRRQLPAWRTAAFAAAVLRPALQLFARRVL